VFNCFWARFPSLVGLGSSLLPAQFCNSVLIAVLSPSASMVKRASFSMFCSSSPFLLYSYHFHYLSASSFPVFSIWTPHFIPFKGDSMVFLSARRIHAVMSLHHLCPPFHPHVVLAVRISLNASFHCFSSFINQVNTLTPSPPSFFYLCGVPTLVL